LTRYVLHEVIIRRRGAPDRATSILPVGFVHVVRYNTAELRHADDHIENIYGCMCANVPMRLIVARTITD